MNIPQLSVVIIGRNEGERLEHCIRSVQAIDYPQSNIETIYVDSNSTDGSTERAKALGVQQVLSVKPERPTAAIGRNAGWRAASAPLILFLDGDTILDPDFVKVAVESFNDSKIAIVSGHVRERYPQASIYQQVLNLDWIAQAGISETCGGIALMRRDILEQVNGFNSELIAGEEPEMCQRIRAKGSKILHIDQDMVLHDLAMTHWSQYWRRSVRTGHAYAEVSNLLKSNSINFWQRESRQNFVRVSFFISIFILGFIMNILWFSGLVFLALSLRSGWKSRWKSTRLMTLFWYGLHSQFQQIPIMIGQLSYYYGKKQQLIEYK
ncbi:glycosyltransferase [Candidatus Marithrix sp. Canyon 246]|uniref:glycosyltransferase n=1 Tax=Candidatus Marithrix sp. Canyon 246 TaxID=1827136 RepID=UPI0009F30519|nr:glycosyltransferase family 2 protein [Candidatus Marithrix sp. Canyon 246]